MLKPLHYNLLAVAEDWTAITGRNFTVDEILNIAADSLLPSDLQLQGVKLRDDEESNHPKLKLHFHINFSVPTQNENGEPCGEFSGRIFIDAAQIKRIITHGFVMLSDGHDTDAMQVLHFASPVKVRRGDLIVTAANKDEFERNYLGVIAK